MFYTGIGSRETPAHILEEMRKVAKYLSHIGYTLRSGKADGADAAFQRGMQECTKQQLAEIYIPWSGFTGRQSPWLLNRWDSVQGNNKRAEAIAMSVHPAWERCSQGAQKLHTRNICQILGADLNTPSNFVLYYAPEVNGVVQGGTATAVHLARKHDIHTINMAHPKWKAHLRQVVFGN